MTSIVIDASDTRPFESLMQSQAKRPFDQAAMAEELAELTALAAKGATRAEMRDAIIDLRQKQQDRIQGRHAGDAFYWADNVLAVADTVNSAIPILAAAVGTKVAPGVGTAGGAVVGLLTKETLGSVIETGHGILSIPYVEDLIKGQRARSASTYAAATSDRLAPLFESSIKSVAPLAAANKELQKVLADLYPDAAGANQQAIDPSAGAVVSQHPDMFPPNLFQVTVDNTVVINDVLELRAHLDARLGELNATIEDGFEGLSEKLNVISEQQERIAKGQEGILALLTAKFEKDEKREQAIQAAAQAQRESAELAKKAWEAANGLVVGATAIASLIGEPQLSADISAVGNGVLNVLGASVQFTGAMAAITAGVTLTTTLGMVGGVGAVLGAAVALIGIVDSLGPKDPPPEQLILQGVYRIEQGLARMHSDMRAGLIRVDERLNQIYTDVTKALGRLGQAQALTRANILELRTLVISNQERLDDITISTAAYFKAAQRLDLVKTIHRSVGYPLRNNGDLMTGSDFNDAASALYTWATDSCFDQVNQPMAGRDYDLRSASLHLRDSDPADNLSYINRLLVRNGLPGLVPDVPDGSDRSPLPNVSTWEIATLAYAQIHAERGSMADPVAGRKRRGEMHEVGRHVRAALHARASDSAFFDGLVDVYSAQVEKLGVILDGRRRAFEIEVLPQLLGHQSPDDLEVRCDIFGRSDQEIRSATGIDNTIHGDNGLPSYRAPNDWHERLAPQVFTALWLSPGRHTIQLRYRRTVVGKKRIRVPRPNKKGGARSRDDSSLGPDFEEVDELETEVYVNFDDHLLARIGVFRDTWEAPTTVWWAQSRPFDPMNRPKSLGPAPGLEAATKAAEDGLRAARSYCLVHLAQYMQGPGRQEVAALDGAVKLIQAAVSLLLPGAHYADDILQATLHGAPPVYGGVGLLDAPRAVLAVAAMSTDPPSTVEEATAPMSRWLTAQSSISVLHARDRLRHWSEAAASGDALARWQPGIDEGLRRLEALEPLLPMIRTISVELQKLEKESGLPGNVQPSVSRTHTVRGGDTLSKIAREYAVVGGWQALYMLNRAVIGSDPNLLEVGTVLELP